jgi:hypothetical protein
MSLDAHEEPAAIHTHIGAIFISLELSRSKWLITSLVPGGGQRMSRHSVEAGDLGGLLARFWAIRDKASARTGICYPIIVIQETGLDGFSPCEQPTGHVTRTPGCQYPPKATISAAAAPSSDKISDIPTDG